MLYTDTKNEIFYAIFGKKFGKFFLGKISFFNEGTPGSVEFNHNDVIKNINTGHNLLGFYHTHPNMYSYMSHTDNTTMDAWVNSEGKELLCIIKGDLGTDLLKVYNVDTESYVRKYFNPKVIIIGSYIFGILK